MMSTPMQNDNLCAADAYIHGIHYMCGERGEHVMHKDEVAKVYWTDRGEKRITWTFAR